VSAISRYYRGDAYFARLLELSANGAGAARDRALLGVLDGRRPSGKRVLDAGCGLGGFSALLRKGNELVGADINEACLRYVTELGYRTAHFDLEDPWPLESNSFDLVLLGDVLEHLFATDHVLKEARRVIHPGGRLVVAVPNAGYWRRRLGLLLQGDLGDDFSDHIRYFSPRSLARHCEGVGLRIEALRPYSWKHRLDGALPVSIAWGFAARIA
jgi:SAM-dependent methyltransferase